MIRHVSILALFSCLLLGMLTPALVQAQSGLEILSSSAQAEFPLGLQFSLSVRSDVDITDIRLCYTLDRVSFAQVTSEVYIEFASATTVEVNWTLEMVKTGGLPPGSSVDYWWLVEDVVGSRIETPPSRVHFDDSRYQWRSMTVGKLILYWYQGDENFAQELMLAAQEALVRLEENTGAEPERAVKLYIYASSQDLQGAMIYPQEWTGGVAFTRYGIVAIGIGRDNLGWRKRAIAHELTHLIIHQMTLNPYNDLPTWLDEGLAIYTEGDLELKYSLYLNQAVAEDSLISLRSLSSPFSAYSSEAYLSYAQSYSLVDFLISTYGQDMMLELLFAFREGSSYDRALEQVYGFDMGALNTLWRNYVAAD